MESFRMGGDIQNRRVFRNPWLWVPSLYYAEAVPYVVVNAVSVILYKRLDVSNTNIAFLTSWLYLPWVIKPFWSPFVDMFRTKRYWVIALELIIALSLAALSFVLPLSFRLQITLLIFWLMAFASATHDIAADGFYMLGLDSHQQAAFVGVRSTFYRIATIAGQGLLVMFAGFMESSGNSVTAAWSAAFLLLSVLFLVLFVYHRFILPFPVADKEVSGDRPGESRWSEFKSTVTSYFDRPGIGGAIAFLLLYRFAEAQLVKMVAPFLLDPLAKGGLGLTTSEVGFAYGTAGIIALMCGGLLGGYVVSQRGLRRWLWPMILAIHLPDVVFLFLAREQPGSFWIVCSAVGLEQFGYGFGFTAYLLFMILISEGKHATAHYAICTGFMALGMALPGMMSGAIQEWLGYKGFFLWVLLSTIPGYLVPLLVKIPDQFGLKRGQ